MRIFCIVSFVLFLGLVAFSQQSSPVPQPPQLTSDAVFASLGRCNSDKDLQGQYINQLQQKIMALNTELEDLKKSSAVKVEPKKGN